MNRSGLFSRFWRQVATLSSGTVISQLLVIGSTPFLTRLYLPDDFGLMGVYLAAVLTLVVVANGGYEMAIMLPEESESAHRLVLLSLLLAGAVCLLIFLIGLWTGPALLAFARVEELSGWHLLLPLSVLLEAATQTLNVALNRLQDYRTLSVARLVKTSLQVGVSLLLGFLGIGFWGLLAGLLAGQVAGTAVLAGHYISRGDIHPWGGWASLGKEARQYADFPLFAVLSNWANTLAKQLPLFLLPGMYGKAAAGYFQQTQKLLSMPIGLLGGAVGSVFYKEATEALVQGGDALRQLTLRTARALFLMGIGPTLLVMLFGPWLFSFFLGENWEEAGVFAQMLMPWMFLMFIAAPLSYLIDVRRKLGVFLVYNLLFLLVQLLILLIGNQYLDIRELVGAFGLSGFVLTAVQLGYLWKVAKGEVYEPISK